ncbi:MAG: hypothetical protein HY298_10975 [Verrucomicrobia bacterium]|nr:hypothetical protein [Verrucomicrobiota bacterium]
MKTASTLNISLAEGQLAWIKKKQSEGFASASDVVRDLIRARQEQEHAALLADFRDLDTQGSAGSEPIAEINRIVGKVKKARREAHRRS